MYLIRFNNFKRLAFDLFHGLRRAPSVFMFYNFLCSYASNLSNINILSLRVSCYNSLKIKNLNFIMYLKLIKLDTVYF